MAKCKRCRGTGREPDWKALGERVRKKRERRGIGVRELARLVKCTPAYISDLERNNRASWYGTVAQRVLDYLKVKP